MKKEAIVLLLMIFFWQLKAQDYELLLLGDYKDTVEINQKLTWFGFAEKGDSIYLTEVKPEYYLSKKIFQLKTQKKLLVDLLIGTTDSIYTSTQERVLWMEKFLPKRKHSWQENKGSFEHLESKGNQVGDTVKNYELFYKFEVSIISRYSKNINPILLEKIHAITGETYTYLTEAPVVSVLHIDKKGSKDLIIKYRGCYFLLSVDCCIAENHNVHLSSFVEDTRLK